MTACSDPGIVFARKPVFDSIDDTDGVLLTNLTQSNANSVVAEERRNSYQSQGSHSSSSSNSHNEQEHLTEEHRVSETAAVAEDHRMVDIEAGEGEEESSRRDKRSSSASSSPSSIGSSSDKRHNNPPNRILITNKTNTTAANPNRNTHNTVGGVLNGVLGSTSAVSSTSPYLPPPAPAMIECGRCHIDRPRDASHCYDCGVCVKKLDHHCPVRLVYILTQ